jgi:hypothetical protein
MLVALEIAGSVAEFISHASTSIPEPIGLGIFGMCLFIVATGIRRRESLPWAAGRAEGIRFKTEKIETSSAPHLRHERAHDVEISKELAPL